MKNVNAVRVTMLLCFLSLIVFSINCHQELDSKLKILIYKAEKRIEFKALTKYEQPTSPTKATANIETTECGGDLRALRVVEESIL